MAKQMIKKFMILILLNILPIRCHQREGMKHRKSHVRPTNTHQRVLARQGAVDDVLEGFKNTVGRTVITPLRTMKQAGFQNSAPPSNAQDKMDTKIGRIKTKVSNFESSKKHAAAGALASVFGGVPSIVSGYKDGDWKTVMSGVLGVASGIASMFGPIGSVVGTVLSLLSSIFSWFGGSSSTPVESQEDMMKRVVETAIEENEIRLLQEEIAGVRNVYTSLSNSLNNFREQNIEPEKKRDATTDENVEVQRISDLQGVQFFNQAFQELVPFGKLKEAISKYCAAGFLREGTTSDEKTKNDKEVIRKAKNCATFVRLYCGIALQRQFLLIDMAAVINDAGSPTLKQTGINFVYMLTKEQEKDQEVLRFLVDPINFPNRRYAVAYFFDEPNSNNLAEIYIKTLGDTFPGSYKPGVMACKKYKLQGRCISLEKVPFLVKDDFSSVFVPYGKKITKVTVQRSSSDDVELNHRCLGASVCNNVLKLNSAYPDRTSAYLHVEETDESVSDEVKFCKAEQEDSSTKIKYRLCRTIGQTSHRSLDFGTISFVGLVDLVTIPEKLCLLVARVGQHAGPDKISNVCAKSSWEYFQILEKGEGMKFVKVCSEVNLEGVCYRMLVPKLKNSNFITITTTLTSCEINVIKSMQIPKAIEVTLYTDKNKIKDSAGPFVGPATISKVAHADGNTNTVKIVDRMQPSIEICEEEFFLKNCVQMPLEDYNGGDNYDAQRSPMTHFKSAKIPPGVKVELYEEKDQGGDAFYTTDKQGYWSSSEKVARSMKVETN